MNMNTTQLEYFISIATLKSFTRAAQAHFVTQTALTQQMQSLEEQLGVRLIDRSCRPIRLTDAGEVFLLEAKAIVERANEAVNRAKTAATGITGSLRIGYIKGYERSNLSEQMRSFHKKYPNIFITCHRCSSDELLSGLISDQFDVIYTWEHTSLLSREGILSRLIEPSSQVAVLYNSHPFAQRTSLTRGDLKGERFLYTTPGGSYPTMEDSYHLKLYEEAGYSPDIIFHSSDAESILMMVAAEEGISIMPSYITQKLAGADNLVFLPLTGPQETENIVAVWKEANTGVPLRKFLAESPGTTP